jgi:hypothetical protein
MYYVKTRADNSGYTNHRVICLVVICSSFSRIKIKGKESIHVTVPDNASALTSSLLNRLNVPYIYSSTFRRKKVELLSSLRRQCLGRLSFRLSFLSESISQKLSKVSIWNVEYLFTIKRGTNYNKADDPVICISRVICPCFDIVHRNYGYYFSLIKI